MSAMSSETFRIPNISFADATSTNPSDEIVDHSAWPGRPDNNETHAAAATAKTASVNDDSHDSVAVPQSSHGATNADRPALGPVDDAESPEAKTVPTPAPPILYKLEWTDENGVKQPPFKSNSPFDKLEVTASTEERSVDGNGTKPVLEIVTNITGINKLLRGQILEDLKNTLGSTSQEALKESPKDASESLRRNATGKKTEIPLDDVAITKIGTSKMIIHSLPLLQALRSVVLYYPDQYLTGEEVEIQEPYSVIVHHMRELRGIAESSQPDTTSKSLNEKAIADVRVLLEFMEPWFKKTIKPIEERLSRTQAVIKFEDLWFLFKPGDDVYLKMLDKVVAGITMSVKQKRVGSSETRPDNLEVGYWVLSSDGVKVDREDDTELIPRFEGEREVTSLAIFPSWFWDINDEGKRRKEFEKRGEIYYNLLRAGNKQVHYDGKTFPLRNKTYQGPAIVDVAAALRYDQFDMDDKGYSVVLGVKDYVPSLQPEDSDHPNQSDPEAPVKPAFKWATYQEVDVKTIDKLTQHQYFLLGPFVAGFALKEKRWKLFDIDFVSELTETDSSYQNLVIEHKNLEIIQAIAHPRSRAWKLDFIQGKGEGQIVLLHGPPGVGKTYTVECISESTGRPLIALTIADIGLDEKRVESELVKWFTLAEGWGAILLIDEADIFLERRKGSDISRNSLVSVFLRKMEYFRGLLFLTTNRIGQIDDAFLSRVHVVIGYGPLDDEKRKRIWQGFFRKLERDMQKWSKESNESKVELSKYAREYVLEDKEIQDLKWNGREIRNAFQTAISLAGYQAIKETDDKSLPPKVVDVRKEHFVSVAQMSREFHTYMDSIIARNEAQRARARMERNDDYLER